MLLVIVQHPTRLQLPLRGWFKRIFCQAPFCSHKILSLPRDAHLAGERRHPVSSREISHRPIKEDSIIDIRGCQLFLIVGI